MSLKKDMESALKVPIRVRAGAPGSLNVFLDGEQVFSKKKAGRFPKADELIQLVRSKTPGA